MSAGAGDVTEQQLDLDHRKETAVFPSVAHPPREAAGGVHFGFSDHRTPSTRGPSVWRKAHDRSESMGRAGRSAQGSDPSSEAQAAVLRVETDQAGSVAIGQGAFMPQASFPTFTAPCKRGPDQLAITGFDPYNEHIMKRAILKGFCLLMVATLISLPVNGKDLPEDKVEQVRTWMTIGGAILGLGIGIAGTLDLVPQDTPFSDSLLVIVPGAAVTAVTAALAGRWIAEITLATKPSLAFSPLMGAGLGMLGGAFSGAVSFSLAMAIALPAVDISVGEFSYLQAIGMAALGGALWGGIFGIPVGAVSVPIVSLYLSF